MSTGGNNPYDSLSKYAAIRLGVSAVGGAGDGLRIVPSLLRVRPESSFSYARVLYWFRLRSGEATVSVAPAIADVAARWITDRSHGPALPDDEQAQDLLEHVHRAELPPELVPVGIVRHEIYACDCADLVAFPAVSAPASLLRITTAGLTYAEGIYPPEHCFPDGTAYGVMHGRQIVSVAYGHRIGPLEAEVADLGVETAPQYRRRGYARACVHGVCSAYVARGGQAWYECSPSNVPSQLLAQSVGFKPWAQSLSLRTNSMEMAAE